MPRPDDLATEETTGSPERPEDLFRALAGQGEPEEPPASAEEQAEEEPEPDPREQLRRLQERIGTEEDVSVVKSQRDRLRNQFEEYQAQVQPLIQQLTQRLSQLEQGQAQSAYQQWEQQWRDYVSAASDPQTRQWRAQEFAHAQQLAQQQMELQQRQQALAQREQALHQGTDQQAQQSLVNFVTAVYEEVGRQLNLDVSKLNKESYSSLKKSFDEQLQETQRQRQQVPPKPPTPPQRRGRTGAPRDVHSWFDNLFAEGNYQKIEDAFRAAKEFQGIKVEDIISR